MSEAADTDTAFEVYLVRSIDGGATYTDAGQVIEIGFPAAKADTYDATHHRSPDGFKESGKGLLEMGEASVTVQFSSLAQLDDFYTDLKSKDPVFYGFMFPGDVANTPAAQMVGHVINVEPDLSMNDRMTAAITIKPTGKGGWV